VHWKKKYIVLVLGEGGKMKKQNRAVKFCPNCKENKSMFFFGDDDEIANYYCFGCRNYWKWDKVAPA
jgi:hypothetical protein